MSDWNEILAALGLKMVNVVVAAGAAFVAMQLWKGLETKKERWATFGGGWMVAAWGGPPLTEYMELKASMEVGMVLLLGLFGMALAAEVWKFLRDTDWKGFAGSLIEAIKRRIGG
jgi:hypothetical protein